jgi:hypothetical protein
MSFKRGKYEKTLLLLTKNEYLYFLWDPETGFPVIVKTSKLFRDSVGVPVGTKNLTKDTKIRRHIHLDSTPCNDPRRTTGQYEPSID